MKKRKGLRVTIGGKRYKFNAFKFFNDGLGAWIIIALIALGMAEVAMIGLDYMSILYHK